MFLVLIGKFDQKSNFQSDWPSALLEPSVAQMGKKLLAQGYNHPFLVCFDDYKTY